MKEAANKAAFLCPAIKERKPQEIITDCTGWVSHKGHAKASKVIAQ